MFRLSSVLAGPIVRRTEPGRVSVWLALSSPASVELEVMDDAGEVQLSGQRETIVVGANLHLVLVTATGDASLLWGKCYSYQLIIDGQPLDVSELLYDEGPKNLSFALPGASLEDTRIVHGSCRHPSKRGEDALTILDDMIADSFAKASSRPQVFACTGDLIYADSPSSSLLALVGEVGDRLLGYREDLPGVEWTPSEIPCAERQRVVGEAIAFEPQPRQLLGFGEYLALHLLCLSPSLWPEEVPADLARYHSCLPQVRRALANTSFYAVFDDHEITDDWYLTRAWAQSALGAPLGRRMIANGLLAFALVHQWGNAEEYFEAGQVGERLLAHVASKSPPSSSVESDLGMPQAVGDRLSPPSGSLPWHFRLKTPAVDLRSLDTRTMRAFPQEDEHGLPDLLSDEAIEAQLSNLSGLPVLIVPSPMAPPPRTGSERFFVNVKAFFQGKSKLVRNVYGPDRGDDWQPQSEFFQRILNVLPSQWVCLGGDTHLAYAAQVSTERSRGAIFCSSGMQRETKMRLARQWIGFRFPWPVPTTPTESTESMHMVYLRSEKTKDGKRFQYFARNNIGTLEFEGDGQSAGDTLTAVHTLWWRRESNLPGTVEHRVTLDVGEG